jgi:hypothetical protein
VKNLSGAPHYGKLLALPMSIRLGWKGLLGTDTLAYYENSQITDMKSFITLAPGFNVTKLFYLITDAPKNKLECFALVKYFSLA